MKTELVEELTKVGLVGTALQLDPLWTRLNEEVTDQLVGNVACNIPLKETWGNVFSDYISVEKLKINSLIKSQKAILC